MSNSPELLKPDKVTDSELQAAMGNLQTHETSTPVMVEDIEFLRQENEDLKGLLSKKNPLIPGHFYAEIEKLKECNRQLRLKIGEERRSSIEKISELEHQVENMLRRNQQKQARLDELEIQIEEVTDSELRTRLSNLNTENENLRADYAKLLESSTAVTNKLQQEVQELRSLLETERGSREEIEAEFAELKQNSAPAATLSEKLTPDAATILNQLRARRKKSKTDIADLEAILEILES